MGLLRTAARAHVATRVIGSTHRRQQQRWAAQDAAAVQAQQVQNAQVITPSPALVAPAVPNAAMSSTAVLDQLAQLGQLRDAGVLTEVEFEMQKQRILAGG